jgi:small subunit ribosomal protein S16
MVRLRFQREGKPGQAYYRLVAIDRRAKRNGRPIEVIGTYNPRLEKDKLKLDEARVKYWQSNGAMPSETVLNLLVESGVWKQGAATA